MEMFVDVKTYVRRNTFGIYYPSLIYGIVHEFQKQCFAMKNNKHNTAHPDEKKNSSVLLWLNIWLNIFLWII